MSEEKKASDKILERIDKLDTALRTLIESHPPQNAPSEKEESAENAWEHVHNCPTCKLKLEKEKEDYAKAKFDKDKDNYAQNYTKEYVKNLWKERKDFPVECEDCGTHVRKEEKECPTCGSTKGRSR